MDLNRPNSIDAQRGQARSFAVLKISVNPPRPVLVGPKKWLWVNTNNGYCVNQPIAVSNSVGSGFRRPKETRNQEVVGGKRIAKIGHSRVVSRRVAFGEL